MSYFLWVEDFENEPRVTASNVFGGVLDGGFFDDKKQALKRNLKNHGIFIELNFQDGLVFISSELDSIDYVILDIDLPAYGDDGINDDVLGLLVNYEGYQIQVDESEDEQLRNKACSELKKIAGFYLYTKLVVELGFPKDHILFCSNHGENTKTIQEAFKTARMGMPKIYKKSDDAVQQWVKQRYDNPYSRLRRGIIEGCKLAKTLPQESLYFNNFTPKQDSIQYEDISSYFQILENFLPLREPKNKLALYKLFVRTLSHEWEAAKNIKHDKEKPDAVLAWIMRNTRHWITHNSSLFDELDERFVAFLFMVNLRVMFKFDDYQQYFHERVLLKLYENESLSKDDFLKKTPPVADAYLELRNLIRDENQNTKNNNKFIEEAFYFNEMANNIQLSSSSFRQEKELFIKLLYQTFWLTTCNPFVDKKNNRSLEIKFGNFKYSNKPYMLELARSIYHRSFPVT